MFFVHCRTYYTCCLMKCYLVLITFQPFYSIDDFVITHLFSSLDHLCHSTGLFSLWDTFIKSVVVQTPCMQHGAYMDNGALQWGSTGKATSSYMFKIIGQGIEQPKCKHHKITVNISTILCFYMWIEFYWLCEIYPTLDN